jgi:hypothetical protein
MDMIGGHGLRAMRHRRISPALEGAGEDVHKKRIARLRFLVLLAFLIGFFAGLLLHDYIVEFNPGRPVWKSFPLNDH